MELFWSAILFLAVVQPAAGGEISGSNELNNPDFELTEAGLVTDWEPYRGGYRIDTATARSGRASIVCEATDDCLDVGASQIIRYEQPDDRPIVFGGWSKAENVNAPDYCIYLDLVFDDGTEWWGYMRNFSAGTHDWEFSGGVMKVDKPVKEIHYYLLLRSGSGKVWFDDMTVSRDADPGVIELRPQRLSIRPDLPCSNGLQISGTFDSWDTQWSVTLLKDQTRLASRSAAGAEFSFHWDRANREPWPDTLRIVTTLDGKQLTSDYPIELPDPALTADPVAEPVYWTTSATQKIWPLETRPPEAPLSIDLAAAGNETETAQIALRLPAGCRRSVAVDVSELVDSNGGRLGGEPVKCFFASNVWVRVPSHHPAVPYSSVSNWTPEILVPATQATLPGGFTQTIWLDFAVPAAQPAGLYRGQVQLQLDQPAETIVIPVAVKVYDFTLPQRPSFRNAFAQMDNFAKSRYGQLTPELHRKLSDLMLDYRLNPDDISRLTPPAMETLRHADERGMTSFCVSQLATDLPEGHLWKVGDPAAAFDEEFYRQLIRRLDAPYADLQREGLSAQGYLYGFDEWNANAPLIEEVCRFVKERYPDWKTFNTASVMFQRRRELPADYEDYVDWYCPLLHAYDPELSRQLRSQGKEVWWYVCCWPRYPYANLAFADLPAIETRLLPWMTYLMESDGLLYWHVNLEWPQNATIEEWQPFSPWFQPNGGDGNLIYPGADGPIPGIRMVNLRDGSEDFEYLAILENLRGRQAALPYAERLIRSLTDFSRNPAELEAIRRELAAAIEQAQHAAGTDKHASMQ